MKDIKIGSQNWMAQNLNVDKFRNGDVILYAKTHEDWIEAGSNGIPAFCNLFNDEALGVRYGKLYNWYAVNDSRGLAPEGFTVPSYKDIKEMIDFVNAGAEDIMDIDGVDYAGVKTAKLLKSRDGWLFNDGLDEFGFKALPGMFANSYVKIDFDEIAGQFRDWGDTDVPRDIAMWWCSDEGDEETAAFFSLKSNGNDDDGNPIICFEIDIDSCQHKSMGFSVRCLKLK